MKDKRITSGKYNREMDPDEKTLRPRYLSEFIGQDKLKDNLFVFITAAKERGESLDHVFFSGPPGLGKTTLSGIIAHELGVAFRATSAPALEKQGDLAAILTTIGEKNVFFIDEIHRLKPQVEEILYSAMEDFEIDVIIGQGPGARTIKIPIPPFTLVGATTKAGLVSGPLYSRFGITARLDFYTIENIKKIVYRSSQILAIEIDDDAADKIALCSRRTPRVANRLLRRMRDFAQVRGDGKITKPIVDNGLLSLEIDARA
jgi:Holliday junction DNA helicase RuvB